MLEWRCARSIQWNAILLSKIYLIDWSTQLWCICPLFLFGIVHCNRISGHSIYLSLSAFSPSSSSSPSLLLLWLIVTLVFVFSFVPFFLLDFNTHIRKLVDLFIAIDRSKTQIDYYLTRHKNDFCSIYLHNPADTYSIHTLEFAIHTQWKRD